jgi:hypothetical protein
MMTGRDNRTPHNELGPHDTPREYARPVEEVANAIGKAGDYMGMSFDESLSDRELRAAAVAAIQCLRDLGYINDIGLRAIKAEERK